MSSLGRYTEIPRESSFIPSQSARGFRKMSCFDSQDDQDQQPRTPKKTFSTRSLPKLNATPFVALSFQTEELAIQLTHIDFELFGLIDLEELISCGWVKKNKEQIAPNIVAYTRRFNHVSFWTVEEVLNQDTPKARAEVISHFLKISKRLYELNNLLSLFAIISALRCASLYRLSQTWAFVTKKEKNLIDKYAEIFSEQDNFSKLREHLDTLKFPCVPHIAVYLTDLLYLTMANPSCNLKENSSANNIFRIITTYQTESSYSHLPKNRTLIANLQSCRYIDELIKFVEDDNYKKSLLLEPPSDIPSPHKSVYLTDIEYLTMANPCNLKENSSANYIFRIISIYQTESSYWYLPKKQDFNSKFTILPLHR